MADIEKCGCPPTFKESADRDLPRGLHDDNTSVTAVSLPPSVSVSVSESGSDFCDEAPPSYPDGGARAWLTVCGAFLALFCTFGQLNSFGTFQTWYREHQLSALPASTIAWIGSLQLWVFFFCVSCLVSRMYAACGMTCI